MTSPVPIRFAFGLVLLSLVACAPQPRSQEVQVWEGTTRILLKDMAYRLVATVNPVNYELRGTFENVSNGDRFDATGTFIPTGTAAEMTVKISAQPGVKVKASILGFGIGDLSLKADALLSGQVVKNEFKGSLRVNGVGYALTLKRRR